MAKMGEEVWMKEMEKFLSNGPGVIIRLRGLPYDCTAQQILDFFRHGEFPCETMNGELGVLFVRKPDGKATGDALVMFSNEEQATMAMTKHKDVIGSRYIELFRTPYNEVEMTIRRTLEAKSKPPGLRSQHQARPQLVPQSTILYGPTKDCLRLRGLPFETQVNHLLDFLGVHAKNIALQGVHMVYNHMGQPSGEAFVQMNSELAASLAATNCHHGFINVGKKQRYVEVFQCSGEDMAAFLSGGPPMMPSPGIGDVPPFVPIFSPPPMEPTCPITPTQPGPVLYFFVNPNEPFINLPTHKWVPEFPQSPILGNLRPCQPDYFVS